LFNIVTVHASSTNGANKRLVKKLKKEIWEIRYLYRALKSSNIFLEV